MSARNTGLRLGIVFFCTAACAMILQGAFDASDHGKAERAVRNYRVDKSVESFGTFVERKLPGGAWSTEITHGCRGVVRASYLVGPATFSYDYDVPGHRIHPSDEPSKKLLEEFVGAR